jgi:hypothetical protein
MRVVSCLDQRFSNHPGGERSGRLPDADSGFPRGRTLDCEAVGTELFPLEADVRVPVHNLRSFLTAHAYWRLSLIISRSLDAFRLASTEKDASLLLPRMGFHNLAQTRSARVSGRRFHSGST